MKTNEKILTVGFFFLLGWFVMDVYDIVSKRRNNHTPPNPTQTTWCAPGPWTVTTNGETFAVEFGFRNDGFICWRAGKKL